MRFNKFNNLIKLTIFCNLIVFDKKLFVFQYYVHPFFSPFRRRILSADESKYETLINGRNFLNICLNFTNYQKYKLIEKPKVSAIIPLFNCDKTIGQAIYSIQLQNISKLEIILVNDFSKDNTSKIIKNFQNNDHRIIIINNHKNMGTLYSRSIGVLIAKGEYIFSLDNDDLFFYYDIFDYFFKKGKEDNLDIIHFLGINIWNYTENVTRMTDIYTYQYPEDYYLQQPFLGVWMIKFKGKFLIHNNMIWDKCIKTSIYKRAVESLGYRRYSKFLSWAEDTCINYVILNIAQSFKYIKKYGIVHFKGSSTATFTQPTKSKLFGEIYFLDIIFDYSRNNYKEKNLIIEQAFFIYKRYKFEKFINDTNSKYLKIVLNKIINCKYTSKLNIRKIKKIFVDFLIN